MIVSWNPVSVLNVHMAEYDCLPCSQETKKNMVGGQVLMRSHPSPKDLSLGSF